MFSGASCLYEAEVFARARAPDLHLGTKHASYGEVCECGAEKMMAADTYVILIVDDDPTFCSIVRECLRADGFDVHLAYDVPEALRLLEKLRPDLILSDIMMPDIDGLSFIRSVRSMPTLSHTPTIVVSARTLPEERSAAVEAGADAFVPKPFSLNQLRSAIQAFLPVGVS